MSILDSIGNKFVSIVKNTAILLTWLAGIALVLSAYSGYINPLESEKVAVIGLLFPIALITNLLFLVLWLITRKFLMVLLVVIFMGACFTPIKTFSPFNISSPSVSDSTFTVLTYNVMNFDEYETSKATGDNRSLQYILDCDADIVVMQEASAKEKMDKLERIQSLMPQITQKYPYRETRLKDLVILSKYAYHIDNDKITSNEPKKSVAYKFNINGKDLYLINVHLESINLTESDRELYRNTTDLSRITDNLNEKTVEDVKNTLISKLSSAFKKRASQSEDLRAYIDSLGDKNIILCGDFNDTPSSYSYLTIKGNDMSDAYVDCAFGPAITFHANRFYFRIDQVLYKGNDIEAVDIKRGNTKSSDHYPLLTTFRWKQESQE